MLLSTDGLPGPVMVKRFGKPADGEPEVGARPLRPRLAQRASAAPADVDAEQRAGHGVEAGGEHEASSVYSASVVRRPSGVIASIGVSRTSISVTLSRLYVS